jgi:hypothetical protein
MSKNTGTSELINYFTLGASGAVDIGGNLTLSSILNATTDTDKFLVSDTGIIKYRTGSELLSDIGAQGLLTNPVTGTGTSGTIPVFTGSTTIGNSIIQSNATQVNIVGNGSSLLFDSLGQSKSGGIQYTNDFELLVYNSRGTGSYITLGNTNLDFKTNTSVNPRLRITDGGNVLINTTTDAGFKLDVNGTGRFSGLLTVNGASATTSLNVLGSGANGILLDQNSADATSSSRLFFKMNTQTYAMLADGVGLNFLSGATAGSSSGSTKMILTSGGQLLVGTGSTDSGISVDFQNLSNASSNVLVRAKNTTLNEDCGFVISANSSGTQRDYIIGIQTIVNSPDLTFSGPTGFQWYIGGTERLRIASTGTATFSGYSGAVNQNNGIKLTNNVGTIVGLEVGGSNDSYIGTISASNFSIRTGNTPILTVSSGGNVLIGTTTDSGGKLRVDGDIFINNSSNAQIGFNTTGALNTVGAYQYFNRSSVNKWTAGMGPADGSDNYQIVTGGVKALQLIVTTGAATFASSVTANGNFELTSGANRQIIIGSVTNYNYRLKTDGDDFAISEAGNTDRLRYSYTNVRWTITGGLTVSGSLSKGSGSFKIDHPLPEKKDTHQLVHSFIEGPQADNIYRGKVKLVDGYAEVNIDEVSKMTEGTFVLLNGNVQCFTSNESGWTSIKGRIDSNILIIESEDSECTDTVSWLVIGERHDQHMIDTDWTDENGKVIVEPLKKINA